VMVAKCWELAAVALLLLLSHELRALVVDDL
jgi:hypothetical protein